MEALRIRIASFGLILGVFLISLSKAQKPNIEGILNRRQDVYIAGFFPFGKGVDQASLGRGVMPSVKLALDHVNEHSDVLRNYRLHMWWNDTECNAAVGVKSFFDMMHSGPHKLMLFGAACTHVTDPIAKASKHWHLTQLSYADTHPMFTKDSFPNFFRIVPSENAFNLPRVALLRHFNWTRVGTIYQNEPRYSLAHNRLVADLDSEGFQVVETQSFATEVKSALEKLKEKDVRIILGNFNESWAVQIFCEAFKLEMFGRSYQWLIMGAYSDNWWTKHEDMRAQCNESEIATSLEAAILTDLLPLSTTGDIAISGITAAEYKSEYDSMRGTEYSRFHGYTYDGIWAVALAIQHVAQRVKHIKKNKTVIDFKYRDPDWEKLFLDALRNISFEGVTGPVRFYDNERKASILLKQFQSEEEIKVGEYCSELNRLDFSMGEPMRWHRKQPPKDRTLLIIEHSQVNITIYGVLAICSVVGIILAIFFLVINITYRNQRYIKMSSPYLNNLIIIGCMFTYLSVIFLGLDSGLSSIAAFPYICTARAWLLMAGFSLAFGAMFSKTWRVHSIFTDVKLNKKVIKDYQLYMVVGVLLSIDLAIMTTWQISDPFYRETKQMDPYPHPSSEDVFIIRENEYCQSDRMTIFVGVIYAYKGLLMIFGAFLAWETRNVSIPALNDSKHVGLSVYNVVIMCVMGAPISLVLADHKDAVFILISIFIIFCTTATLCLVFVPKLVELRRNKMGGGVGPDKRIRATLRTIGGRNSGGGNHSPPPAELERRLREQRATNSRYRKTLQAKESELQMLMGKLGDVAMPVKGGIPGTPGQKLNLLGPKDIPSHLESSEITSLCSLSASQGADEYYFLQQLNAERNKEISTVSASQSSQGESQGLVVPSDPPPKKEPGQTKNVSFKNHTDSSPREIRTPSQPVVNNKPYEPPTRTYNEPPPIVKPQNDPIVNNAFRGHAEVLSSNGSRPVLEKDQLAKAPFGWRQEVQEIIPPKPIVIQQSLQQHQQEIIMPPAYVQEKIPSSKSHRRMSSIGQTAVMADMVAQQQAQPLPLPPEHESLRSKDSYADDADSEPSYSDSTKRLTQRRDSEKRRSNFIVVQSDLWDTNTFQYTCPTKQQSHHHSPIQRSVSEKSQRHSHGHTHSQASTPTSYTSQPRDQQSPYQSSANMSQRTTPERKSSNASLHGVQYGSGNDLSNHCAQEFAERNEIPKMPPPRQDSISGNIEVETISKRQSQRQQLQLFSQAGRVPSASTQQRVATPGSHSRRSMQHHLSTPDVHNRRSSPGRGHHDRHSRGHGHGGGSRRIHAASSESELFECAILPIFQKLLSERHRSQPHGLDLPYGLSCPNISIKCDIVEYL